MTTLDINHVRSQFPALASGYAFLDNAGGSQVLASVALRVQDYLMTSSVQLGANYGPSQVAADKVLSARRAIATLINAHHDDEVVMGSATTSLLYLFTQALMPGVKPGDEIIVTNTDHEANIGCWFKLKQAGAVIKTWKINTETLELDLTDLDVLLSSRTSWVAMTHASNILGTVNLVDQVADRAHAVGAKLCVDAVAYAPHRLIDVQASKADIYVFSFYKVFGPHYAVMWGRRELLIELASLNHYFIGQEVIPYKLQPGNVNYELSYGCEGIVHYLIDTGRFLGASGTDRVLMQSAFDAFELHEDALAERLLAYLRTKPGVRIIGRPDVSDRRRVPTISFVAHGRHSEQIVRHMDQFDIGIRFGDFYAKRLIETLGLHHQGGVVRISIAHYNVLAEIDRLIDHFEEIL